MKPVASFYKQGLKFSCTACGKCCSNHGEYDHVYLTKQDVRKITAFLKREKLNELSHYTKKEDGGLDSQRQKSALYFF